MLEKIKKENILLVYPNFPIPIKRKNHHDFLPIGLLKIGTYLRDSNGCKVKLIFGNEEINFTPDYILITSLFTYWSDCVHKTAKYYRDKYPAAHLIIGGIYASLLPENVQRETNASVWKGLYYPAEEWCREHDVDYSLLPEDIDFQILHGMRGCFRKCKFCGTWKIEPKEEFIDNIPSLVRKNHVIFYDNNFLRHPDVNQILIDLSKIRINGKKVIYESQSGFDGRIINAEIAVLLKKARFINPRIAWDNSYNDWPEICKQVDFLANAGYKKKDIYIFMIYNWDYNYIELEKKRLKCWEWGTQIADCRYRPLDQLYDRFNARIKQNENDYHIHSNWSDSEVKQFRKNVRRHNICIRHGFPFYSAMMEHKKLPKSEYEVLRGNSKSIIRKKVKDAWFPDEFTTINQHKLL